VSILFFLWGFAYGLIGTLSVEIQNLLGYPPSHTIALHAAYWSGYFFGPLLVGYWVLTREGFKATFMAGLAIFATGALSFWPSSVLRSFPGFIVSNFIIALGLSCLEVAANPFIALAGPGELSEARLNFAQGIQGIGTIVSPIVAQIALFSGIQREDLVRVQWCYLAVALFVIFLAIVFYYVPLSEAGDDELEAMAVQRFDNAGLDVDGGRGIKAFGLRPRHLILWSGVLLMWCYDGSQESVAFFWTPIVADIKPNGLASFWGLTIGRSVFTFGRFLTSALCYVGVPPRILLGISFFGAFLTSLLALVLPEGSAALAMLILYYFFEGPIFPTQFAMMMRGQGKHTKFAAAVTMMFNSGAAVWPSVVYGILHQNPATTTRRAALLVVVILYGISTLWPVMISSNSVLRRWVDPKWSKCSGSGTVSVEHGHESPSSSHEKSLTTHLEVMPTPVGGISGD
jgi:fucose permease